MSFESFDLNRFHEGDRVTYGHPHTGEPVCGNINSITTDEVILTTDSGDNISMTPSEIILTKVEDESECKCKCGGKNKKLKNSKKSRKSIKKSSRKKKKSRRRR